MTSFSAGHGVLSLPFALLAEASCGVQAGGFGLVALTGLFCDARCASGSGSSGPFGSPGYAGAMKRHVAGWPSTVIDWIVRLGPFAASFPGVERTKSRLKSLRHCVA